MLGQPKIRRLSTTQTVPKLQAFLSKTIILPHQGAWKPRNWLDQNKTLPLFLQTKHTGCSHESSRCFTYFPGAVSVLPTFLASSWGYFLDKTCCAFCLIEVPAIRKFAVAMDGKETTELHLDEKDEEQKANGNFLIPESRMSCPCKFL